jgi:hypothetical protein
MSWQFKNLPAEEIPRLYAEYLAGNWPAVDTILDTYQVRSGCAVCDKTKESARAWLDWYAAQPGNEYLKNGATT